MIQTDRSEHLAAGIPGVAVVLAARVAVGAGAVGRTPAHGLGR